jgi:tetratricopeptide (TPR) repeat protein
MMPLDGTRLRTWRRGRGWDVPEMARQLRQAAGDAALPSQDGLVRMIRRWESGATGMSERYQLLFLAALGLIDNDHVLPPEATDGGDQSVQRREFLTATSALAGSLAVPPQLAQLTAGRRISKDTPQVLRQRLARLRRLDNYLGGADTHRLYLDELEATKTLAREAACGEATRQQLVAVLGEQAQQAGWAAFDAGWHATARTHYRDSLDAARQAGDRALEGNALALLAYQNLTLGDQATRLAEASCDAIGTAAPLRVQALLHERRAWTLACSGARPREVEQALGQASDALILPDSTDGPDWAAWADETELQVITGRCLTAIGQPRRAIPALHDALAAFDDTQARDKALYLTWLAEAHLETGDIDQAAAVAGQSLALSAGIGSVRPAQRLREIIGRLSCHAGSPAVTELREQAASLTAGTWPG